MKQLYAESYSHWYRPDGTACHFVEVQNGKSRRTTLRDARIMGLYPGVSSICKLWPSDNLKQWLRGRDIIAALTTPRNGESDEEWIARVIECADEESEKARTTGTRRHDILHRFHKDAYLDTTTRDYQFIEPYIVWLREHVSKIENAEYITVNRELGYAGTIDVRCILLDGRIALLDVKNRKRLATYDEDAFQLAAYAMAERSQGNSVDTVISVVLGTEKPELHVNEWLAVDEPWECFCLLLRLWQKSKNYYPVKAKPREANYLPDSIQEALNSGDGSYRP